MVGWRHGDHCCRRRRHVRVGRLSLVDTLRHRGNTRKRSILCLSETPDAGQGSACRLGTVSSGPQRLARHCDDRASFLIKWPSSGSYVSLFPSSIVVAFSISAHPRSSTIFCSLQRGSACFRDDRASQSVVAKQGLSVLLGSLSFKVHLIGVLRSQRDSNLPPISSSFSTEHEA